MAIFFHDCEDSDDKPLEEVQWKEDSEKSKEYKGREAPFYSAAITTTSGGALTSGSHVRSWVSL